MERGEGSSFEFYISLDDLQYEFSGSAEDKGVAIDETGQRKVSLHADEFNELVGDEDDK